MVLGRVVRQLSDTLVICSRFDTARDHRGKGQKVFRLYRDSFLDSSSIVHHVQWSSVDLGLVDCHHHGDHYNDVAW
jgi:hypothetical protein